MIYEVTGDLLLSTAELIGHGVAPNDNFGEGVALSLRERWPAMYKDFRHYCQSEHPECGGVWLWGGADHVRIAALFTQEPAYDHGSKPGKATLTHLGHSLKELRHVIEKEKFKSVALPRITTGVGGLEWAEVKPLIAKHLGDLKIPIYVYTTYKKGVKAEEPA